MADRNELYIGGKWVPSAGEGTIDVLEAATGQLMARVPAGTESDVDDAVAAARVAFGEWSQSPVADRITVLRRIADGLVARETELAEMMAREVGTPIARSRTVQVGLGVTIFRSMADILETTSLEERRGNSLILKVGVGVVGAITPWNYPLYQLAAKVAPAIAAGCTSVVKPSSVAPLAAFVVAEIAEEAGLPPGVLNIVTGAGGRVGERLAGHPGVDLVSLTGSTSAGARVGQVAAADIKKVTLELGGKSAFIVAPDADVDAAVTAAVRGCYVNNGQTCAATTRLLVPIGDLEQVEAKLVELVGGQSVGDPLDEAIDIGPMASREQQQTVLDMLSDVPADAVFLVGGPGHLDGHGGRDPAQLGGRGQQRGLRTGGVREAGHGAGCGGDHVSTDPSGPGHGGAQGEPGQQQGTVGVRDHVSAATVGHRLGRAVGDDQGPSLGPAHHVGGQSAFEVDITAALAAIPELKDVISDQQTDGLQLDLKIDRDSASRLGVSVQAIDDTLGRAATQVGSLTG